MKRARRFSGKQMLACLALVVLATTAALAAPIMIDDFSNPVGGTAAADSVPLIDELATVAFAEPGVF